VVASRIAAGGVDAHAPEHLLVASTTGEYVDSILRILEHPDERSRLALAARARMLSHHAWAQSMRRLDGIIARCVTDARPRRAMQFT